MSVDTILAKLDRVRRVGDGRWVARCPSHESRSQQSLSIRELDDGRVLVHDFGGCEVGEVLAAIGLQLEDLFPPRPLEHAKRERKPWSDRQLLEMIDRETIIVFIAACDITLEGRRFPDVDMSRLRKARERITAIMRALS